MRRLPSSHRVPMYLRAFFHVGFALIVLGCNMPNRIGDFFRTPTPSQTPTFTPTLTSTPTRTSQPTFTFTPSLTPTYTSTPGRPSPTPSPTVSPLPPTLTPGPNQISSGQHFWQLVSLDFPSYISAIGRVFYPPTRRDPVLSYVYLKMNFNCASGRSLIHLYTGEDLGLTFIYRPDGYSDVFVEDLQGNRYLVNLIGACYLAAPLPRSRMEDPGFTLHFKSLPPFRLALPTLPQKNRSILYASAQDLNLEIYTYSSSDGSPQRLTNHPADDIQPAWSGDSKNIVFVTNRDGNNEIYRMDASGNNLQNLTRSPADESAPAWSAATGAIAYQTLVDGNWEIYTMAFDGSHQFNLSDNPEADQLPAWSPDGRRLAFQSHRDGNWEIYVMNADGSSQRRLTVHQAEDMAPAWSPDGSRIAFWSRRDGGWGLYLINSEGGEVQLLIKYLNPGETPSAPAWSRDGQYLVFTTIRDGYLELYWIGVNTNDLLRLTHNRSNDIDPDW